MTPSARTLFNQTLACRTLRAESNDCCLAACRHQAESRSAAQKDFLRIVEKLVGKKAEKQKFRVLSAAYTHCILFVAHLNPLNTYTCETNIDRTAWGSYLSFGMLNAGLFAQFGVVGPALCIKSNSKIGPRSHVSPALLALPISLLGNSVSSGEPGNAAPIPNKGREQEGTCEQNQTKRLLAGCVHGMH